MALNTVDPLQDTRTPGPIVQTAMDQTATETTAQPEPVDEAVAAPAPEPVPAAAPVEPYKAPETTPAISQVDPDKETVEGRLTALTAKGSKYTDLARKETMREANTRGLINTTMAAGAGTEAAIRSALPIAQQDAKTFTDTRMANQAAENAFLKNRQSANLNMEVAAMDSELKTNFEKTMQDERFSDESKIQIVTTINSIMRDTQDQITAVGLSDRSAAQQASSILAIREGRNAQIAVYEDLLASFNDWEWSTDFTPEMSQGETAADEDLADQAVADEAAAAEEARMTNLNAAPDGSGVYGRFGSTISKSNDYIVDRNTNRWVRT